MERLEKPIIFEFDDYRSFLKASYEFLKKTRRGFSYRAFAKSAGLKSPNFLKLVIDGKRNLSPMGADCFIKALGLSSLEAEHFRNLVHLNQAGSLDEKKYFSDQLLNSRQFRKHCPVKTAQYACYSKWYSFPIRELVAISNFREDPEWIAKTLSPEIEPSDAKRALEELTQLGLIRRNKDGKLEQSDPLLATTAEVSGSMVAEFHRQMIQKGSESIERFNSDQRDVSCVTLGLSEESTREVKDLIREFRKKLMDVAAKEKKSTQIVQVNFQAFPLSEASKTDISRRDKS